MSEPARPARERPREVPVPHDRPDLFGTVPAPRFRTGVKAASGAAHAQLRREADPGRLLARGEGREKPPAVSRMSRLVQHVVMVVGGGVSRWPHGSEELP